MDQCLLILLTTMRLATCGAPSYCSNLEDGSKQTCVRREPAGCTTPAPSQTLYTCTRPDGSTYQWNGGITTR